MSGRRKAAPPPAHQDSIPEPPPPPQKDTGTDAESLFKRMIEDQQFMAQCLSQLEEEKQTAQNRLHDLTNSYTTLQKTFGLSLTKL